MARPQAYNTDDALQRATELFWSQGYGATSIDQLLVVMGLSRSSLYHAFGDKRELFIKAMDFYAVQMDPFLEALQFATDPILAIQTLFEAVHLDPDQQIREKGCMFVNTVVELSEVDNILVLHAAKHMQKLNRAFEACFASCITAGTLSPEKNPRALANFFMSVNKGLRVSVRHGSSLRELRDVMETALQVLD